MTADRREGAEGEAGPPVEAATGPAGRPLTGPNARPADQAATEPSRPVGRLVLVTGGARSGKSAFAERLAGRMRTPVTYLATAQVADDEMRRRVERHRAERPADWRTVEAATGLGAVLRAEATRQHEAAHQGQASLQSVVTHQGEASLQSGATRRGAASPVNDAALGAALLEDVGNLVANLLLAQTGGAEPGPDAADRLEVAVAEEIDALVAAWRAGGWNLIVVTNEVGLGVVPGTPVGRVFRDALGRANQRLAAAADTLYLLVAGQALRLKPPCPACSPDPLGPTEPPPARSSP